MASLAAEGKIGQAQAPWEWLLSPTEGGGRADRLKSLHPNTTKFGHGLRHPPVSRPAVQSQPAHGLTPLLQPVNVEYFINAAGDGQKRRSLLRRYP